MECKMLPDVINITNLVVAVVALVLVVWTFFSTFRESGRIAKIEDDLKSVIGMSKRNSHNSRELHHQIATIIESTNFLHAISALLNEKSEMHEGVDRLLQELAISSTRLDKLNLEWRLFDLDQEIRTYSQTSLVRGAGDVQTLRLFEAIARREFGFEDSTIEGSRNDLYVRLGNEDGYLGR